MPPKKAKAAKPKAAAPEKAVATPKWELKLYVAGQTPRSKAAYDNLRTLCDQHIPGQYQIELIDLLKNPALARADQILAIPTLVRRLPDPLRRIIGDLSDSERALVALDIQPARS